MSFYWKQIFILHHLNMDEVVVVCFTVSISTDVDGLTDQSPLADIANALLDPK